MYYHKASIQKLIKELKAVVFTRDELEFRDKYEVRELLSLLAYQDSISDGVIII